MRSSRAPRSASKTPKWADLRLASGDGPDTDASLAPALLEPLVRPFPLQLPDHQRSVTEAGSRNADVDVSEGMTAIHEAGGLTIGQDEASSVVYGMHAAAPNVESCSRSCPCPRFPGTFSRPSTTVQISERLSSARPPSATPSALSRLEKLHHKAWPRTSPRFCDQDP